MPGVKLVRGPQGSFFKIRGITSMQGGGEIDPGMAFNIDGIYNPFSSAGLMSFYDVARIEVLRGPQGTLYGRNAIAGVVNVITNEPDFSEFGGNARVSAGNFAARSILGAVNLPMGDRLAARLVSNYQTHDGYMTGDHDNLNTMSGRGKVLFQAADNLKVGFTFDYGRFWGAGIGTARVLSIRRQSVGIPARPCPALSARAMPSATPVRWNGMLAPSPSPTFPRTSRTTGTTRRPTAIFITRTSIYDIQTTHELRVASNDTDSRLGWQVGAFYYDAGNRQKLDFTLFRVDQQVDTTSTAAFAQASYNFTDKTRATVGLRFTNDKKTEDGQNYAGNRSAGLGHRLSLQLGLVDLRVGLEHDVLDASMVYANVSTGFKAGGVSLSQGPAATFDPEELTAYQAGIKTKLLDNRLSINSEIYYYDYSQLSGDLLVAGPALWRLHSHRE